MKIKSLMLAVVVLLLVAFAGAQCTYPTGPNTGFATTPYDTNYFSATFNGLVTFKEAGRSADNESSNYYYRSSNPNVSQQIMLRTVDHDIQNDMSSAEFYRNDATTPGEDRSNRSAGDWCGHPYTYAFYVFPSNGYELRERVRYIIVNSRTVIFLTQIALNSYDDRNEWLDFEYSLRIK